MKCQNQPININPNKNITLLLNNDHILLEIYKNVKQQHQKCQIIIPAWRYICPHLKGHCMRNFNLKVPCMRNFNLKVPCMKNFNLKVLCIIPAGNLDTLLSEYLQSSHLYSAGNFCPHRPYAPPGHSVAVILV